MRESWIRLAHVGMHPDRVRQLLSGSASPAQILRSIERGSLSVPERARAAARVPAEERLAYLAAADIRLVMRDEEDFPTRLASLPDSPFFLFQRGSSFQGTGVAIVGTRSCTSYGRRLAESYGVAVSQAGWSVVSGLARGIDGSAHRGSLSGVTPGVAVLGSGIDVWYPAEHARLGEELIASGGTIWSESPPSTPPTGWRFPPRNRIISGIAEVIVVVEASAKGGALITARTALDQGREVCATPGDVGRPSSVGCNLLIRDGALPVHDQDDLIECLSLLIGQPAASIHGNPPLAAVVSGPTTIPEFLSRLDSDPSKAIAALGQLEVAGSVVIKDGMVLPGNRKMENCQVPNPGD